MDAAVKPRAARLDRRRGDRFMRKLTVRTASLFLSAAAPLIVTAVPPAQAFLITSGVARVNDAREFEALTGNTIQEDGPHLESGGPASARVQLGDGTNAAGEPAFAQAFSAFQNGQPTYWVSLVADNGLVLVDNGNGHADVHLVFTAIKQHGDTSYTLHVTGGLLQIFDDERKFSPAARIDLRAKVSTDQGTFNDFQAFASLAETDSATRFDFSSQGFGVTPSDFTRQVSFGDAVGATLEIPAVDIPIDLTNVFDDVELTFDLFLSGDVRSPGGETLASAFLRDPAHANDADPFAGAPTITFQSASGPTAPSGVPEPSSLMAVGAACIASWVFTRWRRTARSA
jgi:hypothetical protein